MLPVSKPGWSIEATLFSCGNRGDGSWGHHVPSSQPLGLQAAFSLSDPVSPLAIYCFLFGLIFFLRFKKKNLMWTLFKVFIEFVTILLLFCVLTFRLQSLWDLGFPSRDQTHSPCTGR